MNEEVKHESPFAISSIAVQRTVGLRDGGQLIVSVAIAADAEDVDKREVMDAVDWVITREHRRGMLAERMRFLNELRGKPAEHRKKIGELQSEKAAYIFNRNRRQGERRLPQEMNAVQKAKLEEYDNKIAIEHSNMETLERDIIMAEYQVKELEAMMKGEPAPPRPPIFDEVVRELRPAVEATVAAIKAGAA